MKIKFLNLNILHGGILFDQLTSFLREENADIVTLQEVQSSESENPEKHYHTIENFEKILPYQYSAFAPQSLIKDRGVEFAHGNAIYSRFSLAVEETTFFEPYRKVNHQEMKKKGDWSTMPQNMQYIKVTVNDLQLNVFNVHGIWGHDGEDNEKRSDMSRIIVDKIKGKEKVILAGDFNVRPESQTIRNIEECLKNVFKDELKSTFNMKRKKDQGYATAVVDMVFVSQDINVLDHYCPDVNVSDHMPLVCEFEI